MEDKMNEMKKGKWEELEDVSEFLATDDFVARFFEENRQDIKDNGFSRRVMSRLPRSANKLNRIWTVFCIAMGVAFLVYSKAWTILSGNMRGIWTDIITSDSLFNNNPIMIYYSLLVLAFMGGYQWVMAEK
ncbi:MAG: DUF5056 domain-containing protein [Prevotellaceae bacterium]|nr:DUF5056 domain-containing protein [Prevotellaceae bacterium]